MKKDNQGVGGMTQRLRALASLPEDSGLISSTHGGSQQPITLVRKNKNNQQKPRYEVSYDMDMG